jgi:hypothetical protein
VVALPPLSAFAINRGWELSQPVLVRLFRQIIGTGLENLTRHQGKFMVVILRVLIACAILVFYLPVISGVALAINDAAGWLPGTLTGWWKDVGDVIAHGLGLPPGYKNSLFSLWGIAALLTVIGHALISLARARA